ncbi:hypothetical protein [Paenibacillus oleatilyticus]|uniref:Uncharacterized protein n=1 Tax=Paenibacillus oleatilyticus TaxID=2594886 RepID=A0ABV4UY66_9BACL
MSQATKQQFEQALLVEYPVPVSWAVQQYEALLKENERLTKARDALQLAVTEYEFWIKNIGNPAKEANTAMGEALEQLIEVYESRQRSAVTLLDDPNTTMEQRTRVHGKKEVYRDILLELNRILPINGEGDGG